MLGSSGHCVSRSTGLVLVPALAPANVVLSSFLHYAGRSACLNDIPGLSEQHTGLI
jgi:hypothetical protein